MAATTVRLFASHPVAAVEYESVLAAEEDFQLVSNPDAFQVGVFDSGPTAVEAVLTLARLKFPAMRPVLMSFPCNENECLRWLFRGIWGLVAYDRFEKELPRAVRRVAEGKYWFPAPVVKRWNRIGSARRDSALPEPLTGRENQVLDFLLRRFSNKEIADILNISDSTVKFHVAHVLAKLQLTCRHELPAHWAPYTGLT